MSANYKPLPSQAFIKERLDYDPDTGWFIWKSRPPTCRANNIFNAKGYAGKRAGHIGGEEGYRYIYDCSEQRLAYKYMTGRDPEGEVDHINGETGDNRWINLHCVPPAKNKLNKAVYKNNSSGVPGVRLAYAGGWKAGICVSGKSHHLGIFRTKDEAVEARLTAELEFFGEHRRGSQRQNPEASA